MASLALDDRLPSPHEYASTLYEAHSDWLLRYCLHQLGDHADAEDAVQIVFLYAFRALRRGVTPECERGWLTTIARNVCHEQRRTRRRRPETSDAELDQIALARPDHEDVGFIDEVRAALAALPEKQRRALLLREWQGIPSSEIASELELSEPATHALLFRARRSFANALEASRRSVAGLNVAAALHQLRTWLAPLLEGAKVKAAVATTAAGVVVGGAALEQRIDSEATPSVRPASAVAMTPSSGTSDVSSALVRPDTTRVRSGMPLRGGPLAQTAAVPTTQSARPAATDSATSADDTTDRYPRLPEPLRPGPADGPVAESPRPQVPAPVPPAPPVSVPSVEPPPLPLELPPILGDAPLPPLELPPPLDEVEPPVELPPVEPPPFPPLLP